MMKNQTKQEKKKYLICGSSTTELFRIRKECTHEHCRKCNATKREEWPCLQCEFPENFVDGKNAQYKKCYHCMEFVHSELIRLAPPPSCSSGHQWCYYCFIYKQQFQNSYWVKRCSTCEWKDEGGKGVKQANNATYYQKNSEEIKKRSREYKQENRERYNENEKLRKRRKRHEKRMSEMQRLRQKKMNTANKKRYQHLHQVEERYQRNLESDRRKAESKAVINMMELV